MTASEFATRVTLTSAGVVSVVAASAGAVAGVPGVFSVLAAAAIALVNIRWVARNAVRMLVHRSRAHWALGAAGRLSVTFIALAVVLATEWAHPLWLMIGLAVTPGVLIVEGIRAAGELT